MKTKDVICYLGAPARTLGEVGLIGGVIAGTVYGLSLLITYGQQHGWSQIPYLMYAMEALFVLAAVFLGAIIAMLSSFLFWERTTTNFKSCQEYWHQGEEK